MVFAVDVNVIGVVITSSPGPIPSDFKLKNRPAVHELRPTAYFDPEYFAKSSSNLFVRSPEVSQPERMVSRTSFSSSSPKQARWKGIISLSMDDFITLLNFELNNGFPYSLTKIFRFIQFFY